MPKRQQPLPERPEGTTPSVHRRGASSAVFLDERRLADRWLCSVKKLQSDRLKGTGCRFVRIGRSIRYRLADVEAFEAANVHTSTSDQG